VHHASVLLSEVLELSNAKAGDTVLDVTLGLGGHSQAFLERIGPTGHLVGLDADKRNLDFAQERLGHPSNATFVQTNFSRLPECLPDDQRRFDVILGDLGLSSPHIDDPSRGFMFREDSPLDMRFDQSRGLMAAHYLQSTDPKTLTKVFIDYGELPKPHALVRALVERRSNGQIKTSADLVAVAEAVYKHDAKKRLPQIFQAVRIAVNDEMGALQTLLTEGAKLLAENGRLLIISYHSLEDRMVKDAFRSLSTAEKDPITGADKTPPAFSLVTRKPVMPSDDEIAKNPRARSAVLRAIEKKNLYPSSRS
jgi:16S rRNA (cytosine1402-N4)-methyltransferase